MIQTEIDAAKVVEYFVKSECPEGVNYALSVVVAQLRRENAHLRNVVADLRSDLERLRRRPVQGLDSVEASV